MRGLIFLAICLLGLACHAGDTFAVFTYGGLGNRMFFLAGQVAYARHFNKEICLMEPFDPAFRIPYRLCTQDETAQASQKACAFPRYSSEFLEKDDCETIWGCYLQDERFFANDRDFIRGLFQFSQPLPDRFKTLTEAIRKTNSVAVHIRRTDYLYNPERYATLSLDYYESGADYIRDKTNSPIHLFVFSDDTNWVRNNFRSKHPFTVIPRNTTIEDLHLMSLCHHNIIANSTYSWWGAYLNKNPNKIVIAPDQWDKVDTWWGDDIILKDWVVLPADPQHPIQKKGPPAP